MVMFFSFFFDIFEAFRIFHTKYMAFIVVEGLDGAGKSTQIDMLGKHLSQKGIEFESMHFPRTDSPFFGELIARFLRGELGELNAVDPYVVALLYAGDRRDAAEVIREWLNSGKTVILDRYVYSNIAFQCAKLSNESERQRLRNWIFDLEFNYFGIPKPDINIFLDVPFKFTTMKLTKQREGIDRDYLKGQNDIHEASLSFQENVRKVYLDQPNYDRNFVIVPCSNSKGEMDEPHAIFQRVIDTIEKI
jgi:dTMP kinase